MRRIEVRLAGVTAEVRVRTGLFSSLAIELRRRKLQPPYLVVSQQRILDTLRTRLPRGFQVVTIPTGERAKTLRTASRLVDAMVSLKMTRDSTTIALGGGVVGDVAGFAASIYLRGIPVVQVPTTLLAQVDSSVGGKTGVNHPAGKNLIGTFHQPSFVLVDPAFLGTLPGREYLSGLYEALKYGVIRDPELFVLFERKLESILSRDTRVLEELVYRCLRIKCDVVVADEREGDLRRILNFGHTIGHGLEAALGYRRLRHGEAVAYGMIGATRLALHMGRIPGREAARIEAAVRSVGKLPSVRDVSIDAVLEAMSHDKKVRHGALHFVLPRRVGQVRIDADVPPRAIRQVIREIL